MTSPGEPRDSRPEPGGESAHPETGETAEEIMAGFRRAAGGVSARFTPAQAGIVRMLVGQMAELIAGPGGQDAPQGGEPGATPDDLAAIVGSQGPSQRPDDPVLARLFPDAYASDPEAASDFRRFTEPDLRSGKVAAAQTVLATLPGKGGRVRLSEQDAETWLRALNDVRLALGVRLGITDDYEGELPRTEPDDPLAAYLQVYDWLTFLQETLVRALW